MSWSNSTDISSLTTTSEMRPDSRIFVAGHTGLVGSAILRKLRSLGFNNVIVAPHASLDLVRQPDVESFFARERPEYVFLAAARVGGIVANSAYPADFIYENIMIAANVIHEAYRAGVKKLLNLGSSCIYPKRAPQPMAEAALLTGPLEPTNEPYAVAKIAAIKLCRYYNEQYGANFISLMPSNVYGPNDNFNFETSHVVASLIRKFYLARLLAEGAYGQIAGDLTAHRIGFGLDATLDVSDRSSVEAALARVGVFADRVVLWGTGEPLREFLHSDDLADACVYFMRRHSPASMGEFINIGIGKDMKIRDLAGIIKEATRFKGEMAWDPSRPDGASRKLLDVSRAAVLGWKAGIGPREGIGDVCRWYGSDRVKT